MRAMVGGPAGAGGLIGVGWRLHPGGTHADVRGMALDEPTWWERRAARRRAGSRARAKYRQMRRNWLRRKRKLWLGVACFLVLTWVGITWLVLTFTPPEGRWMAVWASGFVAGGAVITFVALREDPPSSIANWQEGAWGEAATAKALTKLPSGWSVLHDLRNGDYNFDHVVVGPPGLFLLNSKWSTYRLEMVDGEFRGVHPDDETLTWRPDQVIRQAKRDAVDLKAKIQERTGRALWVQPVIVWWGRYDDGGRTVDGVAFVQGKQLVERLLRLPERRDAALDDVIAVLRPGRHRDGGRRRRVVAATR